MLFSADSDKDIEFVCYVHDRIIEVSGGSKGFHDENLVKSALARPLQTAFEKEIYPDLLTKAAALLDSIARNHGFRDGNKRTAMAAAIIFLELNGVYVNFTNEEYENFILYVVNQKPGLEEITFWLKSHIQG
jgi:death on curing protein